VYHAIEDVFAKVPTEHGAPAPVSRLVSPETGVSA